jgi:hypothetical protein
MWDTSRVLGAVYKQITNPSVCKGGMVRNGTIALPEKTKIFLHIVTPDRFSFIYCLQTASDPLSMPSLEL